MSFLKMRYWPVRILPHGGISPLESKTSLILPVHAPSSLRKSCSFLGSVNHPQFYKFTPNLLYYWLLGLQFNDIFLFVGTEWKEIVYLTLTHFICQMRSPIIHKCNFEEQTVVGWKSNEFVLRFLRSTKEKCSLNKLELWSVVWSIGHLKKHL